MGSIEASLIVEGVSTVVIDPRGDACAVQVADLGVGVAGIVGSGNTSRCVVAGQGAGSGITSVVSTDRRGGGATDLAADGSSRRVGNWSDGGGALG